MGRRGTARGHGPKTGGRRWAWPYLGRRRADGRPRLDDDRAPRRAASWRRRRAGGLGPASSTGVTVPTLGRSHAEVRHPQAQVRDPPCLTRGPALPRHTRSEPASWQPEMDAPDQVAHLWCTTLPPGIISGHGSVCAHEGGPTRAGESMREAMSRPACGSVTGPRGGGRSSTATLLDGDRCTRPPHPRTPRGDQGRRREGQSGKAGAWGRGPWAREGGSRGRRRGGRGSRGSRGCEGWASWPREIGRIGVERGRGQRWPGKLALASSR